MDYALILFVLLVVTGSLWAYDLLYARKRRAPDANPPWWMEWGGGFFPVILIVFALRSFVVEPFRIPSGSMLPTLLVGDFIAVNKWVYGLRLPLLNTEIVPFGRPQRGDVIVFRYPVDPRIDYIKRVVGLPGDDVIYADKRLIINGELVPMQAVGEWLHPDELRTTPEFSEKLGETVHSVLIEPTMPAYIPRHLAFPYEGNCTYTSDGIRCTVPEGHYFVMGDNRDDSSDSRIWGFVPEDHVIGKAFFIWFNLSDLKRIGSFH